MMCETINREFLMRLYKVAQWKSIKCRMSSCTHIIVMDAHRKDTL